MSTETELEFQAPLDQQIPSFIAQTRMLWRNESQLKTDTQKLCFLALECKDTQAVDIARNLLAGVAQNANNKKAIGSLGLIKALIPLLDDPRPPVLVSGVAAIATSVADMPQNQELLCQEEGIVQKLVSCLSNSDNIVKEQAMRALMHIGRNAQLVHHLANKPVCSAILSVIPTAATKTNTHEVQQALSTLVVMCERESTANFLLEEGVLKIASDYLSSPVLLLREYALSLLGNACKSSPAWRDALANGGGGLDTTQAEQTIGLIIAQLQMKNASIVRRCMIILHHLVAMNPSDASHEVPAGKRTSRNVIIAYHKQLLPLVLRLIPGSGQEEDQNPLTQDPAVTAAALALLSGMTFEPSVQQTFAQVGGVGTFVNVLPRLQNQPDLLAALVQSLNVIINSDESSFNQFLEEENGKNVGVLLQLLKAASNERVSTELCRLLSNVCIFEDEVRQRIVESKEVLDIVVSLLRSDSIEAQRQSLRTLTNCCLSLDLSKSVAGRPDVLRLCVEILRGKRNVPPSDPSPPPSEYAIQLMVNLSANGDTLGLLVKELGGMEWFASQIEVDPGSLSSLSTHDARILLQGLKLMTNLTQKGRYRKWFCESKGFLERVRAIQAGSAHLEEVQSQATTVLSNLSFPYEAYYPDEEELLKMPLPEIVEEEEEDEDEDEETQTSSRELSEEQKKELERIKAEEQSILEERKKVIQEKERLEKEHQRMLEEEERKQKEEEEEARRAAEAEKKELEEKRRQLRIKHEQEMAKRLEEERQRLEAERTAQKEKEEARRKEEMERKRKQKEEEMRKRREELERKEKEALEKEKEQERLRAEMLARKKKMEEEEAQEKKQLDEEQLKETEADVLQQKERDSSLRALEEEKENLQLQLAEAEKEAESLQKKLAQHKEGIEKYTRRIKRLKKKDSKSSTKSDSPSSKRASSRASSNAELPALEASLMRHQEGEKKYGRRAKRAEGKVDTLREQLKELERKIAELIESKSTGDMEVELKREESKKKLVKQISEKQVKRMEAEKELELLESKMEEARKLREENEREKAKMEEEIRAEKEKEEAERQRLEAASKQKELEEQKALEERQKTLALETEKRIQEEEKKLEKSEEEKRKEAAERRQKQREAIRKAREAFEQKLKETQVKADKADKDLSTTSSQRTQLEGQGAAQSQPQPQPQPQLSPEQLKQKMVTRRTNIAREILDTEQSYVEGLEILVNKFKTPILASQQSSSPICSIPDSRTLFSCVDIILNFNKILLESIIQRLRTWSDEQQLGDIFMKMTDFLKCYIQYVNNYNESMSCLSRLRSSNSHFSKFLKKVEGTKQTKFLSLESFLIMPVQRVPRYVMLLADLIKNTWQDHPDYQNLQTSLSKMQECATSINEKKREYEAISKLYEVASSLVGKKLPAIIQPHRRFIKEGPVRLIKNTSSSKSYMHLFNDLLVFTVPKRHGTYEYKSKAELVSVIVSGVDDTKKFQHMLQISSNEETPKGKVKVDHVVMFESDDEREAWVQAIGAQKADAKDRRYSFKRASMVHKSLVH